MLAHPQPADILLVIEVSDSTLDYDQTIKRSLYAEAQINHYWIVNLVANQLEQYSQPYQDIQGNFGYRSQHISLRQESVTLPEPLERSLHFDKIFPNLKL